MNAISVVKMLLICCLWQQRHYRTHAAINCYTCDPNYGDSDQRGCPKPDCEVCGTEFDIKGFSDLSGSNIKRTCLRYPKTNFSNEAKLWQEDFCQKEAFELSGTKCICHKSSCNSLPSPTVFVHYTPRLFRCFQSNIYDECAKVQDGYCLGQYCVFAHQYEVQEQWRKDRKVYHTERHCARSCLNVSSKAIPEGCVYVNRGQQALCYCRGDFCNIDSAYQTKFNTFLLVLAATVIFFANWLL